VPRALPAHDRQDRARDIHGANEAHRELAVDLLGRQLLEEARVEAGGVVDEHVDAAEAVDRGPDGGLSVLRAGHVELDGEQVVGLAHGTRDGIAVATGGHDVVAGGQRGLRKVDAHATAGAGDEPRLLVSHCGSPCRSLLEGKQRIGPSERPC
jgi:hypothetical protein